MPGRSVRNPIGPMDERRIRKAKQEQEQAGEAGANRGNNG